MHFHMPKPLHGWRGFLGEVGIIVIGVLIALGAEQLVENAHAERRTQQSLRAIRAELAHSAGVFDERVAIQPCLDKRIDELGAVIAAARRTHQIPELGEIGRPPTRPIQSTAWSMAAAEGVITNFPDTQRDLLSIAYSQAASYSKDADDEQQLWAILRLLEHSPGPIDGALLADATTTLERLRFQTMLNGLNAGQLLDEIRSSGISADYFLLTDPGEKLDHAAVRAKVNARSVCRPLVGSGN